MTFNEIWLVITLAIAFLVAAYVKDEQGISESIFSFLLIAALSGALYVIIRFWKVVLVLALIAAAVVLVVFVLKRRRESADQLRGSLDDMLGHGSAAEEKKRTRWKHAIDDEELFAIGDKLVTVDISDEPDSKAISTKAIDKLISMLNDDSSSLPWEVSGQVKADILQKEYRGRLESAIIPVFMDGRPRDASRIVQIIRYLDEEYGEEGQKRDIPEVSIVKKLKSLYSSRPPILSGTYGAADPKYLIHLRRRSSPEGWTLNGSEPLSDVLWGTLLAQPPYTCAALLQGLWQLRDDANRRGGRTPVCQHVLAAAIYMRGHGGGQALELLGLNVPWELEQRCRCCGKEDLVELASMAAYAGSRADEVKLLQALKKSGALPDALSRRLDSLQDA